MEPHGHARGPSPNYPLHKHLNMSPKFLRMPRGLSDFVNLQAQSDEAPRLLVRIHPRLKAVVFCEVG